MNIHEKSLRRCQPEKPRVSWLRFQPGGSLVSFEDVWKTGCLMRVHPSIIPYASNGTLLVSGSVEWVPFWVPKHRASQPGMTGAPSACSIFPDLEFFPVNLKMHASGSLARTNCWPKTPKTSAGNRMGWGFGQQKPSPRLPNISSIRSFRYTWIFQICKISAFW